MLPPPPKRTRPVAPVPETSTEGSPSLAPPPSSRDRRNRRVAVQPIGTAATSPNSFSPSPSTFAPLSTFSPFTPMAPMQPFEDEPEEPEVALESTKQEETQIDDTAPSAAVHDAELDSEEHEAQDTHLIESQDQAEQVEDEKIDSEATDNSLEHSESIVNEDLPSPADEYDHDPESFPSKPSEADTWDPEVGAFGDFSATSATAHPAINGAHAFEDGEFYDPEGGFVDHVENDAHLEENGEAHVAADPFEDEVVQFDAENDQADAEVVPIEEGIIFHDEHEETSGADELTQPAPHAPSFDDWGSDGSDFGEIMPHAAAEEHVAEEEFEDAQSPVIEQGLEEEQAFQEDEAQYGDVPAEPIFGDDNQLGETQNTVDEENLDFGDSSATLEVHPASSDSPPLFESAGIPIPYGAAYQSQNPASTLQTEESIAEEDSDVYPTPRSAEDYKDPENQQSHDDHQELLHDDEVGDFEIDSTSRRVLASLTPLDTTIHSILEVESEVSSIASAEAIAEQRADLLAMQLLPTISEEEQLFDNLIADDAETGHLIETIEAAVEEAILEENITFPPENIESAAPIDMEDGWNELDAEDPAYDAQLLKASEELELEVAQNEALFAPSEPTESADAPSSATDDEPLYSEDPLFEDSAEESTGFDASSHQAQPSLTIEEEPLFGDDASSEDPFEMRSPTDLSGVKPEMASQQRVHLLPSEADGSLFDSASIGDSPRDGQLDLTECDLPTDLSETKPATEDDLFDSLPEEPLPSHELSLDSPNGFDSFEDGWSSPLPEDAAPINEVEAPATVDSADLVESQPEEITSAVDDFGDDWSSEMPEKHTVDDSAAAHPVSDSPLFEEDLPIEEPSTVEDDAILLGSVDESAVDQENSALELPIAAQDESLISDDLTPIDEPIEAQPSVDLSEPIAENGDSLEIEDALPLDSADAPVDDSLVFDDSTIIDNAIEIQSPIDLSEPNAEIDESLPTEPSADSSDLIFEDMPEETHDVLPTESLPEEDPHVFVDELPHIEEAYVDSLQSSAILPLESSTTELADEHDAGVTLVEVVDEPIEEEIPFSELHPTEAEDLFNQYKDSLKEHQATLTQLLEEREEMRLELEKVLLEYGPISELESRMEAYAVELDSVLARIASPEVNEDENIDLAALEVEQQDLEVIVEKYKDAISRRFNEKTETSDREEQIVAQVVKVLPPPSSEAAATVADLSEATSPRVSSSELRALQDKLGERDDQISELSDWIERSVRSIAALESELEQARNVRASDEEAKKMKENTIEGLEEEILQNENFSAASLASLPMEDLAAQMQVLTISKVKAVIEATEMRNEVEELKRRLKIEVSALDSQLAERETENVMLREQLSSATVGSLTSKRPVAPRDEFWDSPRELPGGLTASNSQHEPSVADPQLSSEIEKLRKSYDTTRAHLSKCEAELEVATARAEQLDQLFKAESQLRHELQQTMRESKRSAALGQRNATQNSPTSTSPPPHATHLNKDYPNGTSGNNISEQESSEMAEKHKITAEKLASLEALVGERDVMISTLEGEIERLSVSIEQIHEASASAQQEGAKEIERLISEISALRTQGSSHETDIKSEYSLLDGQRAELESRIQRFKQDKSELFTQKEAFQLDKQLLDQQRRKFESEQRDFEYRQNDSADAKLESSAHETKLQEHLAERDILIQELELELDSMRTSNSSLTSEAEQLKHTLSKLERRYHHVKKEAEESLQKLADAELAHSIASTSASGSTSVSALSSDLEVKIAELEQRNAELEQELSSAVQSHISAESSINEKSALVQDLQSELESVTSALESVRTGMNSNLEAESAHLHTEKAQLAKRVEELEMQISAAEEAHETQHNTDQLRLSKAEAEIDAITQELEFTRRELQQARDELEELQAKASALAEKAKLVDDLETSNSKLSSDVADLKKQLDDKDKLMFEAYAAFESELGYTAEEIRSQVQPPTKAPIADDTKLQSLKAEIDNLRGQASEAATMKATAEKELEILRSEYEASLASAKADFESEKSNILDKHTSTAEELKHRLEKALRDHSELEAILAEKESLIASLQLEVQALAEENASLGTQADSMTSKTASDEQVKILRTEYEVSIAAAEAAFEHEKDDILVKQHELVEKLKKQGLDLEQSRSDYASLQEVVTEKESLIASLQAEMQVLAEQNATLGEQSDEQAESAASDLRAQLSTLTATVQALEASLDQNLEDLSTKSATIAQQTSELEKLSQRCSDLEATNADLEHSQLELVSQHTANKGETNELLTAAIEERDSLNSQLEALQSELSNLKAESSSRDLEEEAHKANSSEISRLTSLLEQSESALATAQEELVDQRSITSDLEAEANALRESAAKADSLSNENAALLSEQQSMKLRLKELEDLLEQGSAATASSGAHTSALEEKLKNLEDENAALLSEQQAANSRLIELEQLVQHSAAATRADDASQSSAEGPADLHLPQITDAPASASKPSANFSIDFGDDWDADGDDAWALDDPMDGGIVSTSPVEQQAELEYLREFLKTKTHECESLKRQLVLASAAPAPAPAAPTQHIVIPSFKKSGDELNASSALNKTIISDSPLFAPSSATANLPGPSSSSLPASPYVAPQDRSINKSTSALTPAAVLFDDFDDGWGDDSFDPEPIQSSKSDASSSPADKAQTALDVEKIDVQQVSSVTPATSALSDPHPEIEKLQEELSALKEKLSSMDAVERHNESLKAALENRSTELSDLAEEYETLQRSIEDLQQKIAEVEEERNTLKLENEKLDAQVQQALATAESQKQEFESTIEALNEKVASAARATVVEKSASQEKLNGTAPSPSAQLIALQAELERSKTTVKTLQTLLASKPSSQTNDAVVAAQRPSTTATFTDKIDFDGDDDGWDNWGESAPESAPKKSETTPEKGETSASAQATQRLPILEREIDSLRLVLEQKDADLSTLRVQVAELKTEISDLQAVPKADKSEILRDASLDHEEEIAKLEARHAKELESMELRHIEATEASELHASESLSQTIAKAKISAKAEVEGESARRLQTVEETHTAQKELLENELASRASRVSALESEVDSIRTKLESTLAQYDTAQAQLKAEKSHSSTISSRVTQLESDNQHLQLLVEELQQERTERNGKMHGGAHDDEDLDGASHTALKESFALQLEEAKEALVRAEAIAEAARERGEEATRKVSTLNAELSSLQAQLNSRDAQFVELQSKYSAAIRDRDHAQLDAEENVLGVKEESRRLRSQIDRLKSDLDRWAQREKDWKKDLEEARDAEAKRAAEVSVYLKRLETLQQQQTGDYASDSASLGSSQGIPGSPSSSSLSSISSMYGNAQLADWVEKTLKSQSSITEKLTTENAKLSKGLVSGLVDAQTPVERLAAAKQQLQLRVDRLEKDVRRMKTELVARTEERDSLRQQVDALNTQKGDLARKVAASPAARYHSPAAHFSSYATAPAGAVTPLTPYSHNAHQHMHTVHTPSATPTHTPPVTAVMTPSTSLSHITTI